METILGDMLLKSTTPALLLSAGLLMGLLHVLEPDHVAAMLTQAKTGGSGRRRKMAVRNSLLGAFWGLGHTSAILLVGVLVFVLSLSIPAPVFGWFEVAAGAMIITLGALVLAGRSLGRMHSHIHSHDDGTVHSHPHDDTGEHLHSHRSYLIGCVHGLAGSGVLIALGGLALGPLGADSTVARWFIRRRGRALAFTTMGMSSAGVVLPLPLTLLIEGAGWRR